MAQHQNLVIQVPRVLVQCAIDTTTNGTVDLARLQILTRVGVDLRNEMRLIIQLGLVMVLAN
jgi:hypothetical protein